MSEVRLLRGQRAFRNGAAWAHSAMNAACGRVAARHVIATLQAVTVCSLLLTDVSYAQPAEPEQICDNGVCSTRYASGFFTRYAPVTALDMVQNLPGFVLEDGDQQTRGFAGAAGNILINGQRVSAKTEQPSQILSRVPAADVEEIVLIRGQLGGLDLQGQTVVANVVRRGGDGSGAWTLGGFVAYPATVLRPSGDFTYSGAQGDFRYTASLEARQYQGLVERTEELRDMSDMPIEFRDEVFDETGEQYVVALTATVPVGRTALGVNAAYEFFDEAGGETSLRTPVGGETRTLFQGDTDTGEEIEIGVDAERGVGRHWTYKLIGLYRWEDFRETGSLVQIGLVEGDRTDAETVFESIATETIARLEIDYAGWDGHLIELALEAAVNRLESEFTLREREDNVLIPRDVPGANTVVEEERVDVRLSDAFQFRGLSIEAALGAETSTITQTGDFEASRSFFFLKPSLTVSYAVSNETQLRGRLLRDVGQLDFSDFVSAADLGDVELSLGNPDLSPAATSTLDVTVERRFGDIGVVSMTAFHDWIEDVQDLLPLEGELEVPGNIGSGTRSGLRAEITLPLDDVGLVGGRLDATGSWQTSSVTDPLTGRDRALSAERPWRGDVRVRQDLVGRNLAWSVTVFAEDEAPIFGLDERNTNGGRVDADAFVESRAFAGLRMRLGVDNIFRDGNGRDRRVFDGPRNAAALAFREVLDTRFAREYFFEVTGVF